MGGYRGGGKREVPVVHGGGARPTADPVFGLARGKDLIHVSTLLPPDTLSVFLI